MIHTGALLGEKCGVYTRKEKNRNIHAREVVKTRHFQQLPYSLYSDRFSRNCFISQLSDRSIGGGY